MIIGFGSKVGEIVSSKWDMIRKTLGDLGKPCWIQVSLYGKWDVSWKVEENVGATYLLDASIWRSGT